MSNLRNIIRHLASDPASAAGLMVCEVKAVDTEARTVDVEPLDEGAPLLGVNLQANQDSTVGVVQIPRVGSSVVVAKFTGYDAGVVVLMEDIERMEIVVGNYSLEITDEGITLNGGSLGGLVKVAELTQRLNAIEQDLNALKTVFSGWTPAPQDGGAALKTAAATWFAQTLTETQQTDIENQYVKQ
ncbi:MAG: hypothetical protein IJT48_10730 [Bacteroidaceae bacterium]|nr:hypothetical protein [Bacteroidaceae bacterium]